MTLDVDDHWRHRLVSDDIRLGGPQGEHWCLSFIGICGPRIVLAAIVSFGKDHF